jgi:hypothetical protein
MELINNTRMVAGYTMGLEPSGRELLVVVIKGTFVLPKAGEEVRLHEEQLPLIMADTFTGKPGFSAPVYEVDFAPRKPFCDVLLLGSAHAPGGREVTRMRVGLRVGQVTKTCEVVGDRVWQAGLTGISASAPRRFSQLPVSYDVAFGGADRSNEDESKHDAYLPNPVGRGWHKHLTESAIDGAPLPTTEQPGEPVISPTGTYRPMAFGPVGRGWPERARHAGTYDQHWLQNIFPFLPADFDERYYQAAPVDQQVPVQKEPIEVVLSGFTSDGVRQFVLPHFEAPVFVFPKRGQHEQYTAAMDAIVIEPDQERVSMSWRVSRPLKRSLHEIAQVLVGRKSQLWWHEQNLRREALTLVD